MANLSEKDMEMRLVRLEENVFFQDSLHGKLHEALLSQQQEIALLQQGLENAQKRIRQLEDAFESLYGAENIKPPHY